MAIRTAADAGLAVSDIAAMCAISESRVAEIIGPQPQTREKAVQLPRRGCAYCYGKGVIESCRACRCKHPNFSGAHEDGCEDGWIYVYDFCDRCEAGTAR